MKFCDNPECPNHTDVSQEVFNGKMLSVSLPGNIGDIPVYLELCRHEFMTNKGIMSLCTWCYGVVQMIDRIGWFQIKN